ncbi:uncharacterized protein LOC119601162 isoform X2 [Lucilia sericata]|uniref:uncharacterized protein LOC119601162 isoform X2 n=1 Tax=Lucilia sericata TaxID=13632 RepID=UPI0018A85473|nr:uncharacterized protein LOC119601162 isoform X2 [Lucilia sericata]
MEGEERECKNTHLLIYFNGGGKDGRCCRFWWKIGMWLQLAIGCQIVCTAALPTSLFVFFFLNFALLQGAHDILDEGSSVTMMDSSLVRQLGLQGRQSQLNLSWYGGKSAQEAVMVVDLHVSGVNKKRKYALKNVYGVSNLKLPSQSFNADLVKNCGVPLCSYECVAPKVLIGLDHCHLGLPDEIVPLEDAGPYAANTPLGWVVFGNVKIGRPGTQTCLLTTQLDNLNNLAASYFETENFGVKALPVIESRDDLRAREILRNSTKRVAGRFESRQLWCNDDVVLPDSSWPWL